MLEAAVMLLERMVQPADSRSGGPEQVDRASAEIGSATGSWLWVSEGPDALMQRCRFHP